MVRITTWNVNGIRNPLGYQPWSKSKTYNAMFDILEADIVIMQELKIQRKDLTDDMVLVPGWDCYFSLPKHKKGEHASTCASHVLIHLRLFWGWYLHQAVCMRAHPCRRRSSRRPLPTRLVDTLPRAPRRCKHRRLSDCCPSR
jgi:hypothetical protein